MDKGLSMNDEQLNQIGKRVFDVIAREVADGEMINLMDMVNVSLSVIHNSISMADETDSPTFRPDVYNALISLIHQNSLHENRMN